MIVLLKSAVVLLILYIVVKFVFLNIPALPYRWYKVLRLRFFENKLKKGETRFKELVETFKKNLENTK